MFKDVSQLTTEEKVLLTSGDGQWKTHAVADIPSIVVSDGPHGLRKQNDNADINDSVRATCFPTACAVASSWNVENAKLVASCIADEAVEQGVSIVLGPGINVKRSPLCGRNFEYFSEDPTLAAHMSNAYVISMQGRGIGCCLKHFAVNSQETRRMTVNAFVDERALREIYLSAFEYVVKKAQPFSVMASYNKINGCSSTENHKLLTEILRNEWGFQGAVISDWGACYDTPKAISAGMDLEMPGDSAGYHRKTAVQAIANGVLDEQKLNEAAERVSKLVERCAQTQKSVETTVAERHEVCRKVEADSAVLLKNDNALPLSINDDFCVIGELATKPRIQGAGSSHINTTCKNFLQVLSDNGIPAPYAKGYCVGKDVINSKLQSEAVALAQKHKNVLFFGGLTDNFEGEGYDRKHLGIPQNQQKLLSELHKTNANIIFVAFGGSPFEMPWLDDVSALLNMYLGGEAVMEAAFDLIFGKVSPSGRLAETFPLKLQDTPCYNYFANDRFFDEHRESVFVGYRYYNSFNVPVLFPFGYGLSYSKFEYSNLKVVPVENGFTVSVDVKNMGNRAAEVVQLYVDNCSCGLVRPKRELRAFAKIELDEEQSQTVTFKLNERDFSVYKPNCGFVAVNGRYGISICQNVEDVILTQSVDVIFGENLVGDDQRSYPDYFKKVDGTFTISDDQFEALYGYKKQPVQLPKRGEFTLLNTFEDMQDVHLIRFVMWAIKKIFVAKSAGKSEDDPVVQMTLHGSWETPLISTMSVGKIDARYVKFLLHHANREHCKALRALFDKYTID